MRVARDWLSPAPWGSPPGPNPPSTINPVVRPVMDGIGIDLSTSSPNDSPPMPVQAADIVITMGRGDACPVFRGKRDLDWVLTDLAGKTAEDG